MMPYDLMNNPPVKLIHYRKSQFEFLYYLRTLIDPFADELSIQTLFLQIVDGNQRYFI